VWPVAVANTSFAVISFQPVPDDGNTLAHDLFAIDEFLLDQPEADIVIHQTWPLPGQWEAVHHAVLDHSVTNRSLLFGYYLVSWLDVIYPGRRVVLTRSNEMLDRIYHDCLEGACPLPGGFYDMFRDASGHMSYGPGRYLQHNALRAAFGQTTGVQPSDPEEQVSPEVKAYLDGVVAQYLPEPRADVALGGGLLALAALARRRRRISSGRDSGCRR
jgi:hypothetical protein